MTELRAEIAVGRDDLLELLRNGGDRINRLPRDRRRYVSVADLPDDQDLIATGVVDSLFLIQLMTFLEPTFGIKVRMQDLALDNFRTLNACHDFIEKKRRECCADSSCLDLDGIAVVAADRVVRLPVPRFDHRAQARPRWW